MAATYPCVFPDFDGWFLIKEDALFEKIQTEIFGNKVVAPYSQIFVSTSYFYQV